MAQHIVPVVPNPHTCRVMCSTCYTFSPNIKLLTSYKYLYPSSPVILYYIYRNRRLCHACCRLFQTPIFPHCHHAVHSQEKWMPFDKLCMTVGVTKKYREDMTSARRDGAFIYGLFLEEKSLWNDACFMTSILEHRLNTHPSLYFKYTIYKSKNIRLDCMENI